MEAVNAFNMEVITAVFCGSLNGRLAASFVVLG